MCGIAGAAARHADDELLKRRVFTMTEALRHRGPDSAGFLDAPHLSLGVRRLAIIDVEHGDQPLFSEDRQIAAIANCEIYNHVELREQLIRRGHTFATHSDAEVIVHLYEEHGTAFVEQLRGMFAIALWDAQRRRLMLARDRMGEKPLYLLETPEALYFASEMKSLLVCGEASRELDPVSVHQFLHYSFVPEPRTAIRGVRKLPAATWMTLDLDSWKVEERRYWNMEDAPPIESDPVVAVREKLEEIAEIVVRSDVPVGIALSGGLDSTTIAALVAKKGIARCISVGYPGRPENDESGYAEETARELGLPFTRVELPASDVASTFEQLVARQDDPIADIAGAAYAAVAWAAHETGTKVLLQGQGGDELFWGYPWVAEAARKTKRKERLVFYELTPQYQAAERLFRGDAASAFARSFDRARPDVTITALICETYLRCNGLAQADRLSMSYSVEPRNPLVDHRLVETVIGLRKHASDAGLPPKSWLREAARDLVPAAVLARPKRGFRPPGKEWRAEVFERHGKKLVDGRLAESGLLDRKLLRKFASPWRHQMVLAFPMLVLELWWRSLGR